MSARRLFAVKALCLLALVAPTPVRAQSSLGSLGVRIVDPSSMPIPGARVTASTRDGRIVASGITANDGTLRLNAIAADYVVGVDAAGFKHASRVVSVASREQLADIRLQLAVVEENVVVSAIGQLQTTSEVAKAVSVVDADEIEARGKFAVADALRSVPGATVQQLGGPGAFASIKLRGLREQDTSILIDGVRFRDAASAQGDATAFISDLYVTNLDRIEVLRGSASSLYGSHATGGVVNLITNRGAGRRSGEIAAETGGLGFTRIAAHTGGGVAADRVTVSLGAAHTRNSHGVDSDDAARNTSVQGRAEVRLGASAHASLRIYGSDAASAINESPAAIGPLPTTGFVQATPTTFIPGANDPDNARASDFLSTLLSYEHRPSSVFGYTVSWQRVSTDRIFHDGPLGVSAFEPVTPTSSRFAGTIDTLDARTDHQWSARQTTRLSYEFERERYESAALPVNRALAWTAAITQDSHAVAVHHEVRFDSFQAAASLRAQRFDLAKVALVPAERAPFSTASFAAPPPALTVDLAATRRVVRTGTKLRVHAGNAYRAPAMFERTGVSFGSRGYSVFGDPGIEPERSIAVDAGVDQTIAKGRGLVSVTWFHTRLTRVIAFQSLDRSTDPFDRSSGYRSADGRTARGVEFSARLQPYRGTQATLAYTFVDAPPPTGNRDGLPRAAAIAAHQFSAFVTQHVGAVQLSFELEAAGDHFVTLFDPVSFGSRAYRFGGFTKADVGARYQLPFGYARTWLFGTMENAFDVHYLVQGFRAAGRVARGGVAVMW
jgi:vitamin B12 transporter